MGIKETLNRLFVELFRDINNIEERQIKTGEFSNLTLNDMHVINAIGTEKAKNMSSIAKTLNVTMGTLTIAVNGLVKKGYVERVRSEEDRRVVLVSLTAKGKKAYNRHGKFHQELIDAVAKQLSEEEQEILAKSLGDLHTFFQERKMNENLTKN
ncbi:MAG: MarR family transcriptional regulator [Lachnospiraceae bacterium]|nr:MarR family transcriptional regulator [Lachnospiraceae bacterium]